MQTVLTKYWLAVHVGLLLLLSWSGLSSLSPSGRTGLLWLSLLAVETLVLLPTVLKGETLSDARQRVAKSAVRDPFFYLGGAVLVLAVVQWLNSGCSLVFLTDAEIWQFSAPPVPWAPFSVQPADAQANVALFGAVFAGGLILRNSVGKAGKRLLLQCAAALSGAVACWFVWQATSGGSAFASLAASPGASAVGPFFSFWLLVGMGGYAEALARGQRASEALFAFGFVGNLVGMLYFASAPAAAAYSVVALLLVVYWLFYLRDAVSKVEQLKLFLMVLLVAVSVAVSFLFLFPGNPVAAKLAALADPARFWESFSGSRGVRVAAALKLWNEHLWVGVGANGFTHFVGTVVEGKDWALIKADRPCVFNDSVQFLCEFGLLGLSLLGSGMIALVVPVCYRLRVAWQRGQDESKGGGGFLLRLSPLVVAGGLAAALCCVESWFGSPFRSGGLVLSWVFVMASLPSFLPSGGRASA